MPAAAGGRLYSWSTFAPRGRAGRWRDRITPLSRRLFAGTVTATIAAIRRGGVRLTSLRTLADVPAAPWGRPIVAGVALAPAEA
jgi:hypothetical protein